MPNVNDPPEKSEGRASCNAQGVKARWASDGRQMRDWTSKDFLDWDRDEMESYFVAGGGEPSQFNHYWELELKDARASIKAIDEGTYHSGGLAGV